MIPDPKFQIGSEVLTTKGVKGEIIGYFFYENQLYYSVNHLNEKGKYKLLDIKAEEIEKVTSQPLKNYRFKWTLGQSMNSVEAVLCGIRHYRRKNWYYIDYLNDPYMSQWIYWHKITKN